MIGTTNLLMAGDDGYNLTRSLRFRASASAYLNRTMTTATNNKMWTWSGWVKRGKLSAQQPVFGYIDASAQNQHWFGFLANDCFTFYQFIGGVEYANLITSQVFRDPSAWYHIQVIFDSAQATASNRMIVYVNGVKVTSFTTANYIVQNGGGYINSALNTGLGTFTPYNTNYYDGYMAEVNFIDGQALTPTAFGAFDPVITTWWKPKKYTGTYGTNGFYLPFTDNSALTTSSNAGIGKDFSGNGNYWTTNNISLSAANSYLTYDSVTDVPTLTSTTVSNYPTFNPLNAELGMDGVLANGNLSIVDAGGKRSTMCFPANTGKWYWETKLYGGSPSGNFPIPGIYVSGSGTYYPGLNGGSLGYFQGGDIYYNGTIIASPGATANGDVIMFAYDATTGKIWVGKNGTWLGSGSPNPATGTSPITTMTTGLEMVAGAYLNGSASGTININFGQIPFSYTVPSGFLALNTFNIPAGSVTTSGSFTGNASADGPSVYLNGVPTAMTINGNAVTFATHVDKTAYGFKLRTSSSSYNASGTNTYSVSTVGAVLKYANAQGNP